MEVKKQDNKTAIMILTTVCTAPGFCTLRALTTWNTSTTPSVLHLSIVVAIAQSIPDLLTVSLYIYREKTVSTYDNRNHVNLQCIKMGLLLVRICTFVTS